MDRKTVDRMLKKLQQQGHCKCLHINVPVVMNCGRSRFTQRTQSHVVSDAKAAKSEAMRANGFVFKLKAATWILWGFLSSPNGWDDALSLQKHMHDQKNHGLCILFSLEAAIKAFPLELFLQVVGTTLKFDDMIVMYKQGSDIFFPSIKYNGSYLGRLPFLIVIILIRLVPDERSDNGVKVPHANLTHAMEPKPYIEEPLSLVATSTFRSLDLRPRIRHDFILLNREAVDDYWKTLEYCYAAADPKADLHAFLGSAVHEDLQGPEMVSPTTQDEDIGRPAAGQRKGSIQSSRHRRFNQKLVKLWNEGNGVGRQVRKYWAVSNAVELFKLVFLSTYTAPPFPNLPAETLRHYSEHDLLAAFSYLRDIKIMRIDLIVGEINLTADLQCGDIFHLFSLVSSGELSVSPCLPDEGVGEAEDLRSLKRRAEDNELCNIDKAKKLKSIAEELFKDEETCTSELVNDETLSLKVNSCSTNSDHMKEMLEFGSNVTIASKYSESLWEANASYAEHLLSKLSDEGQGSHFDPEIIKAVCAEIQKAGDQGLSIEDVYSLVNMPGEKTPKSSLICSKHLEEL
ncbi:hypothetical protein CRYUN_Cryun34aG0062600 [Craigia yunnanensis]